MPVAIMSPRPKAVGLLLAVFFVLQPDYVNTSRFRFTNLVCDSVNESMLLVNTCRLRAVRRGLTTLNINTTLLKTVTKCQVDFQIFKKASGFKPWLYKGTIEGCRFLRRPFNPPVILVYNLFKSFSNLNRPCPYNVMDNVYLMGFYVMVEQIPVPLPTGDYLILIKWYIDNVMIISTGIYFTFEENLVEQ